MTSLLDLLPKEERERAIEKGKKRLERKKTQHHDVSPEMFAIAELGYYYGWEAVMAIKRGYITKYNEDMKIEKSTFTLEEAITLIEAAKKVWYSKVIDTAHAQLVAEGAAHSKNPGSTFIKGMEPFIKKAQ